MSSKNKTWTENIATSWGKWTPPDRPSPGEMRVYEDFLKQILSKKKKPNVMVLGSTSEFRDLYAKYKVPCTVVDYRKENYEAMGTLMKRKKYKETLLTEDWRTMNPKQKFDLILGDYCINVLFKKDQPEFVKNISRILKPDGLCMIKTFVRYDSEPGDLAQALHFYRTKKKDRPILETIMAPMFKNAYDYKKEQGTFPGVWNNFVKLYKNKKMKKEEIDYFESLDLENIPLKFYIPLFQDIIKIIEQNAGLYGVRYGGEWFSTDVPILIMKKQ
ncbi:MAG: hypothetical protein A2479_01060 [Candidatus Magasanikbacteria bacterium RIFOXYC2_FULL_39_8]|nr:MAG: hypothetical protein A2479_01060 [Candidatus Magasanikbacteria bacterium RIFOXYC2_FULL_39_8]